MTRGGWLTQARRAADEIPNGEFISLEGRDHYGAQAVVADTPFLLSE